MRDFVKRFPTYYLSNGELEKVKPDQQSFNGRLAEMPVLVRLGCLKRDGNEGVFIVKHEINVRAFDGINI